ncbi:caspase family protein [candidate division WOR-3 bacterium]|nr:caspase family protein [candidate division WOR-3 bacterium]
MRKKSFVYVTLLVLAGIVAASAGLSVGIDARPGYALWSGWSGLTWSVSPTVYWHAPSRPYGFGVNLGYGCNTTVSGDSSLDFSAIQAYGAARLLPIPFMYLEAAAGYGLFTGIEVSEGLDEAEIPQGTPLARFGVGARVPIGGKLICEVELGNSLFFAFRNYWNPGLKVGFTYDFGMGKMPRPIALASDVDTINPKSGVAADPNTIAVLMGASNYKHSDVVRVEYALRDMYVMRDYLVKILGFAEENVFAIEDPVLSDFTTWFGTQTSPDGKLARKASVMDKPKVFIYYSGHGVPSLATGDPFLVPTDCDPNYPEQGGYALMQLYENLEVLDAADVTVVIDACFSGSSPQGSLLRNASPLIMEPLEFQQQTPSEFTVITAAGGRQVANWLNEEKHGLFTYYFLKGLRGNADNGDHQLTWGELKTYVESQVSKAAADLDREQIPVFSGDEEKVLTELR